MSGSWIDFCRRSSDSLISRIAHTPVGMNVVIENRNAGTA